MDHSPIRGVALSGRTRGKRISLERAEAWAEDIARSEETSSGEPGELDVRSVVLDEIEHAVALPPSKRPSKAIAIDPRFGVPHHRLAWRYLIDFELGWHGTSEDRATRARAEAQQAIVLDPDPVARYRSQVIAGPGAFVEIAENFVDYPRAILRKLLREIDQPMILSENE